jgi:hypothetical protein
MVCSLAIDPPKRTPPVVCFTGWVKYISFTQEVKNLGSVVELSFDEEDVAAVCNSRRRMVERWGQDGYDAVSQRLHELVAVRDLDDVVGLLPGAAVHRGSNGFVEINFDDGLVVIGGSCVSVSESTIKGAPPMDTFRITTINMDGLGHMA